MSGAHRAWTPEQRAAQRVCLASHRAQPGFNAKRLKAIRAPENIAAAGERLAERRLDPDFNAAHAAAMARPEVRRVRSLRLAALNREPGFAEAKAAAIRSAAALRRSDRAPPEGYREVYDYLLATLFVVPKMALEIVREQAARDREARRESA